MRFYFRENVVKEFFTTVGDFIQTSGNQTGAICIIGIIGT